MTEHEIRSHRRNPKPVAKPAPEPSRQKRLSRTIATSALAVVVGALVSVVILRPGAAPVTASTVPMPVASASPGNVVGCDPIDPTLAPDGQLDLPLRCYLPPAEKVTETVVVTTPVPVTTTVTETITVTPSRPPVTTPPATTPPPTSPPPASGWPGAANTGVPASTVLTAYTGPCAITVANTVIDSKTVNCTLSIRAANVTIRNSRINGGIENGTGAQPGRSFTVTDTDIVTGTNTTGIGESYFTAERVDISGGNRGANCFTNCTVRDSYIHGNRVTGDIHASGLRAGMNTTYVHNYLQCTVGGNCSADLTGYPDFSITTNWDIRGNFFGAVTAAQWCAYDGAVGGKPYSNDPANATNIRFVDNVFARGTSRKCGQSSPVAFDGGRSKPGWVFTGNRFDDGVLIP